MKLFKIFSRIGILSFLILPVSFLLDTLRNFRSRENLLIGTTDFEPEGKQRGVGR